jgi:hypothetical protein
LLGKTLLNAVYNILIIPVKFRIMNTIATTTNSKNIRSEENNQPLIKNSCTRLL